MYIDLVVVLLAYSTIYIFVRLTLCH